MIHTQSDTPLEPVLVVHESGATHVWLRRNIRREVADGVYGEDVGYWEADEVSGTLPGTVTARYVTDRFAQLWAAFEEADLTDRELIAVRTDTLGDGLAELAAMAADAETTLEVHARAIEELAELVGGE